MTLEELKAFKTEHCHGVVSAVQVATLVDLCELAEWALTFTVAVEQGEVSRQTPDPVVSSTPPVAEVEPEAASEAVSEPSPVALPAEPVPESADPGTLSAPVAGSLVKAAEETTP